MTRATARGTPGRACARSGGSSVRIALSVDTADVRSNGRAPASISYRNTPRLKMSVR